MWLHAEERQTSRVPTRNSKYTVIAFVICFSTAFAIWFHSEGVKAVSDFPFESTAEAVRQPPGRPYNALSSTSGADGSLQWSRLAMCNSPREHIVPCSSITQKVGEQ